MHARGARRRPVHLPARCGGWAAVGAGANLERACKRSFGTAMVGTGAAMVERRWVVLPQPQQWHALAAAAHMPPLCWPPCFGAR